MGIKDWFGGDKKKAAYREKVKEAVSDGKLSGTDMHDLQKLREELDVTDAADDRTSIRREIYDEAFDAKRSKGELNQTGVLDLAKIQKFLALRDDQISYKKVELNRLTCRSRSPRLLGRARLCRPSRRPRRQSCRHRPSCRRHRRPRRRPDRSSPQRRRPCRPRHRLYRSRRLQRPPCRRPHHRGRPRRRRRHDPQRHPHRRDLQRRPRRRCRHEHRRQLRLPCRPRRLGRPRLPCRWFGRRRRFRWASRRRSAIPPFPTCLRSAKRCPATP